MKQRILIVEDEDLIAKSVAFALRRDGYDTEIALDGQRALEAARARPPDLIILDIVLPGVLSGYDVCREIRAESWTPIVMVSARSYEADKILGLERGADDYVTKPFSTPELVARVRARLRRSAIDGGSPDGVRRVGDLTIDVLRREVKVEGEPVHLTPSEFLVLEVLSERAGKVVTGHELISRLWSADFVGDTRACSAHIRRLRSKIEADPHEPQRLLTVRGVGYKLAG